MDRRQFLKTSGAVAAGISSDRLLGMDREITREDYVAGEQRNPPAHAAQGLSPSDWDGFSGVGDYKGSNGNTHKVMMAGHGIRDGLYNASLNETPEETYDCVVIGGGISGLAAAQTFLQRSKEGRCLVLENHDLFGGEARRNEFDVNGHRLIAPQGSAMFFPALKGSSLLAFYESMGFDGQRLQYQEAGGEAAQIRVASTTYAGAGKNMGMYFGSMFGHPEGIWVTDPWSKNLEGAPFPAQVKAELLAARHPKRNPVWEPKAVGDDASRTLDRMTQEELLMQRDGLSRETIRTYMPYASSGAGASGDVISAFADFAPDLMFPWDTKQGSQMFPGGNTGIARYQVKALVPDALPGPLTLEGVCRAKINLAALDRSHQRVRIRLGSTVFAVKHEGDPHAANSVAILCMHNGKWHRIRARSVVMAGGWPTWRVVEDLPETHREAYQQFFRMPCMVANIALTNWRFLAKAGISQARWYEGLGESFAIRRMPVFGTDQPAITPDSPTVITLKIYFTEPGLSLQEQAARGRMKLLSTPYSEYERTLREQFNAMFARWGFDAKNDIAGIILNRWGHAYLVAQPGFFFGDSGKPAPREVLRSAPFNRIAFANSDLSGIMDHRASIDEAQRAVGQLVT